MSTPSERNQSISSHNQAFSQSHISNIQNITGHGDTIQNLCEDANKDIPCFESTSIEDVEEKDTKTFDTKSPNAGRVKLILKAL